MAGAGGEDDATEEGCGGLVVGAKEGILCTFHLRPRPPSEPDHEILLPLWPSPVMRKDDILALQGKEL